MKKKIKTFISSLSATKKRAVKLVRQPVFLFITISGHAIICFGALLFYYFEAERNPNIHSPLDALYWAVATVTTVGYGDIVTTSNAGKILGMVMMIFGSLFLWSYTALFVSALVGPEIQRVEKEVHELEENVGKEATLDINVANALIKEIRTLTERLNKLERKL